MCSYAGCDKPMTKRLIKVGSETKTGGQDWSQLRGKFLCDTCYCRYKRKGTLKRTVNK